MPSAQANLLTQRHSQTLGLTVGLIVRQVRAIAGRADVADIDAWWDREGPRLERLVARGFLTAAELGARYLVQHAALAGVRLVPVRAPIEQSQIATSLLVTGPVAFKSHMRRTGSEPASLRAMQTMLAGSAQRLSLAGQRRSVTGTIESTPQIVGYRRQLNSPKPCAFCAMLASRGAVYKATSATTVVGRNGALRGARQIGESYHDHCSCTTEPLYENEPEPASVTALRAQWDQATVGLSGAEALTAFRHSLDAQPAPAATAGP